MIVGDLLRRGVKVFSDRVAIHYKDRALSYAELNERVNRLANSMLEMGIQKGDNIAILSSNSNAYLEVILAGGKIGAATVTLNARLKGDELTYIINNSDAKALYTTPVFLELIGTISEELPLIEHYICIGESDSAYKDVYQDYEKLLAEGSPEEPASSVVESDVLCLLYTSGTTGLPKGVMLTHRNILANCTAVIWEHNYRTGDKYLMPVPLFHNGGLIPSISSLMAGSELVIHESFNPSEVLRSLVEDEITHAALVVAMIHFVMSVPGVENHKFEKLRYIIYGGSPISSDLLKRAVNVFGCDFIQGYGLTEATSFASLLRPADHNTRGTPEQLKKLFSAGKEMLGIEVSVINEQGKEVNPGEMGEVVVRGATVMAGYWKMPQETEQALRDGMIYSGDIGTVDEEGYIYIMERKNDMIISGGENIYPREIEEVLSTHPAVADVAVIGVPDPAWGESVKALIIVKEGKEVTEQEIIDFCASKMAGYKKPKSVEFRTELPRNPAGKVLKRILREPYWGEQKRSVS
ncbi:MAG: long-chain-fatty-acid--CoA ligase [Deltaproteobacteria bacterium]|nr:long-chain-fatty-acid--CoA ligase [Deltaproteobacteria bacterium]